MLTRLIQQLGNGTGATSDVVEDLHEQLRQKDERIKKLKKSTLTKEQVAAMKKLKVRRMRCFTELFAGEMILTSQRFENSGEEQE